MEDKNSENRISRREFLAKTSVFAAGVSATGVAEKLNWLLPDHLQQRVYFGDEINPKIQEQLRQFKPITVAHNAGNYDDDFKNAVSVNPTYVEVDLRRSAQGIFLASHDELKSEDLNFNNPPIPTLTQVKSNAKDTSQNLYLDLKGIEPQFAEQLAQELGPELLSQSTFSSTNWQLLDRIAEIKQDKEHIFYSISTKSKLKKFVKEQEEKERKGIAINIDALDSDLTAKLKAQGVKVIVYAHDKKLDDPMQALTLLQGELVDGINSFNLTLLKSFTQEA